jgi:hypothetical protein
VHRHVLSLALMSTMACASVSGPAAAAFVYRYKDGIIAADGVQTPTNPTNPGGGTVDPADPEGVACGADDGTHYSCTEVDEEPSTTGAPPIEIVLTGDPTGGKNGPQYSCMHVSGGNGNFVFMASPTGVVSWIKSIDIVPRSDLNAPASNATGWFQYPDYDGDFDIISKTNDICIRITPNDVVAGAVGAVNVNVTIGDYTDDGVVDGRANYVETPYDSIKEISVKLSAGYFAIPQSNIGMSFFHTQNLGVTRWYGPAIYASKTDTGSRVVKGQPFYYQCWKYNGGFGSDKMQYTVSKYPYNPVPEWVDWFDLRSPAQLDLPYQALAPDHPGSQDASWPQDFPYDQTHVFEAGKEVCLRVAQKAGNTSTEAFSFTVLMSELFPVPDGTVLDSNTLGFKYDAIPVFNDPADDWQPDDDDGDGSDGPGDGDPS